MKTKIYSKNQCLLKDKVCPSYLKKILNNCCKI